MRSKIHRRVMMGRALRRKQCGFFMPLGGGGGAAIPAIQNSLRFSAVRSCYGYWTPAGAGNRQKFTVRVVFRDSVANSRTAGLFTVDGNSSLDRAHLGLEEIFERASSATQYALTPAPLYRDPSGFCDLCIGFDTTQATAADRVTMEVNGRTVSLSGTYPPLNHNTLFNAALLHALGRETTGGGVTVQNRFDGVIASVQVVVGQKLPASTFGAFDSYGEWRSKSKAAILAAVGSFGTNGRFYDFADTTNTTTLGQDVAGTNHMTLSGTSVTAGVDYDPSIDVPNNASASGTRPMGNYCAFNPLANAPLSSVTFSNANLKVTTSTVRQHILASLALPTTGKVRWELRVDSARNGYTTFGIARLGAAISSTPHYSRPTGVWGFKDSGVIASNGSDSGSYSASAGTLWEFLYDADAGTLDCRNNGAAYCAQIAGLSGQFIPYFGIETPVVDVNFGQRPWEGSGFGAGERSHCTTNLSQPTINPANTHKITLATGANIDADVATARSGWADYVDIKKNRDAAGSWLWQFSHDGSNEYAIAASSVTRQAKSSLSGSNNYLGRSIRIGAAYGTAAGSVAHTNGADTTVTHNVGVSARQMIFLFPRAGGTAVKVYHPDLASGKLLNLCSGADETIDATIKTVTSNSFKIDSTVASGTYDYLVMSELTGLLELGKHTGNGSSDGPCDNEGISVEAFLLKSNTVASDNWRFFDAKRDPYNPYYHSLSPSTNAAENVGTANRGDFLSTGVKIHSTDASENYSGATYIYAMHGRAATALNANAR